MQWILELLGFKTSAEKKKRQLAQLREKAFQAQRAGNLRLAGKFLSEAEILETQIIELEAGKKH